MQLLWNQVSPSPDLKNMAHQLNNMTTILEKANRAQTQITWEEYKLIAHQTLSKAINLWESQHLFKASSPFQGDSETKKTWKARMEGICWCVLRLASMIATQEDTRTNAATLNILHRYVTSKLRFPEGESPLHALLSHQSEGQEMWNPRLMKQFLWAGANVNERLQKKYLKGYTIFHRAALNGHAELEEILKIGLEFGAHLDITAEDGWTVPDIIRWRHQHGTPPAPPTPIPPELQTLINQPRRLECIAASTATRTWERLTTAKQGTPKNLHQLLEIHGPNSPTDPRQIDFGGLHVRFA
jgi:hypothetical protein